MAHLKDEIGNRYGSLLVVNRAENHGTRAAWVCKCDCGKTTIVAGKTLRSGLTKSCGHTQYEGKTITHGMTNTELYRRWHDMKDRCLNRKRAEWNKYGGRGITFCDDWRKFEPFMEWALSNGYEQGLSLDRVDVNGNYCPDNCRWIPINRQARNTSKTVYVEFDGENVPLRDVCERTGADFGRTYWRIRKGWSLKDALEKPARKKAEND